MDKTLPPLQLKPQETELLMHLAQGATCKEVAETLAINRGVLEYTLAQLRRRFFARTNPQLLFLFAMLIRDEVRKSIKDAAALARENVADRNQHNTIL